MSQSIFLIRWPLFAPTFHSHIKEHGHNNKNQNEMHQKPEKVQHIHDMQGYPSSALDDKQDKVDRNLLT